MGSWDPSTQVISCCLQCTLAESWIQSETARLEPVLQYGVYRSLTHCTMASASNLLLLNTHGGNPSSPCLAVSQGSGPGASGPPMIAAILPLGAGFGRDCGSRGRDSSVKPSSPLPVGSQQELVMMLGATKHFLLSDAEVASVHIGSSCWIPHSSIHEQTHPSLLVAMKKKILFKF